MKILISGSRDYKNLDRVDEVSTWFNETDTILVGDARGVDQRVYDIWKCHEGHPHNFELVVFHADWYSYGKKAGILRNIDMLNENPHAVVCFWDGVSRGTKHVIDESIKRELNLNIIYDK